MSSEQMMEERGIIRPEDVLESLMNDGTIDALRLKIINKLKSNEELKKTTVTMVEHSKVLNTPASDKLSKRQLFDSLRQELEAPVLEKASKSVWDLILDDSGLGKEISETVERVFCRLSGREPPLYPASTSEGQQQQQQQQQQQEKEKEKEENQGSGSKKRTFSEMAEGSENAVNGSAAVADQVAAS